jgi:hypothetical protein
MTQDATAHDREDCLAGECEHPDHFLLEADVHLEHFLTLVAGQRRDEMVPEIASNYPVIL